MSLINFGKAFDKLKSTTQLGGGIVIPRNLFEVGFPQMFSNDRTRLTSSSTFAARAQGVFGMTLRDSFRDT